MTSFLFFVCSCVACVSLVLSAAAGRVANCVGLVSRVFFFPCDFLRYPPAWPAHRCFFSRKVVVVYHQSPSARVIELANPTNIV